MVAIPERVVAIAGIGGRDPGMAASIRRKAKRVNGLGVGSDSGIVPPFYKGARDAGTESEHAEDSRGFAFAVGVWPEPAASGLQLRDQQDGGGRMCRARPGNGMQPEATRALSGHRLEQRLYPRGEAVSRSRPAVDWAEVHRELKGKDVTLQLVWEEYREREPQGYSYSRYCELYQGWRRWVDLTMRQVHRAGEKLFVDYCGRTVPVVVSASGEVRQAQVFVAVWGASNYTYAEATWTQSLPDWIGAHVRAFEFSGGVPEIVVPDNTHTGVKRPCRYEPTQSHVPGSGHALRRGGDPGPRAAATRQGQSRSGRAGRPALDSGAAAPPDLLLARRAQPRHPRIARAAQ